MDMLACFGKKLRFILLLSLLVTLHAVQAKSKPALIDVKIGVMESLSPTAPSSSERYKRFLEAAIYYAAGENETKLSNCGYRLVPSIYYFDTYDTQELINVTKKLEDSNAWVIIGPRRSGHFLTAAKNLNRTPIISTMANADEIYALNNTTFSMYPSASQLAKLLSSNTLHYGNKFATVVDVRCKPCIDFARAFTDVHSGKEAFTHEVACNTPDLKTLIQKLQKQPIDFLLLPNYSDLSGFIIAEVHKHYPNIRFIGGDGWGEDSFSLMQGYGVSSSAQGVAIRAGIQKSDKAKHYKVYSLDREINQEVVTPPNSVYSVVSAVRILTNDLCEAKAEKKESFTKFLAVKTKSHFQTESKYALYQLADGKLTFAKYVDR